ncbi:MAG: glycosyltransferase family 2 protein [Deltaproteobacteria bacterium]|nr:glycosyltransferase family 2 protein [Deltaproteobacteria bacterium]
MATKPWQRYLRRLAANEISTLTRYSDRVIQGHPLPSDTGDLLKLLDAKERILLEPDAPLPDLGNDPNDRSVFLLNGALNHHFDVEALFAEARSKMSRGTRLMLVAYNPHAKWLYDAATFAGLRTGEPVTTYVTFTDLQNLAKLTDLELVRIRPVAFSPHPLGSIGDAVNSLMPLSPSARAVSSAWVITLRPIVREARRPTLSIVIPARNERGNIENALRRLGTLDLPDPEIIFVEGSSTDQTYEEIERVRPLYSERFEIKAARQPGRGKNDAVRVGFGLATRELLTILDADLTMPPELLPRFYEAYVKGAGDFINGNRLTYPMEGEAMQFLNRLGNVFFAKSLSWVLDASLGDSLCGTKLFSARDYARMVAWRNDFGDFDPFGDFELLFPAAVLGLGIVDVPIRYRAREYGSTNIRRFEHGLELLRMTRTGMVKMKTGRL